MVSSEEIIERSFYMNLLYVALKGGYTLDPDDYLNDEGLPTEETEAAFIAAKKAMSKFVYIFGPGNNQDRGIKEVPRITIDLQGYYPGEMGLERYQLNNEAKDNPMVIDTGYCAKDVIIDVHLIARTTADLRLLHSIMYRALPTMGYIKPFKGNKAEFMEGGLNRSENIFIEVGNYYDHQDNDHGLLEKVYQYKITNGVVDDIEEDTYAGMALVPIKDISVLLGSKEQGEKEYYELNVNNTSTT